MNKKTISKFKRLRRSHHLKLKDLAYILGIDSANLSRFEAGKYPYPKALVGYHILFNLSIQSSIRQAFKEGYKELVHRCFKLLDEITEKADTINDRLRKEGLNVLIGRLTQLDESYGQ